MKRRRLDQAQNERTVRRRCPILLLVGAIEGTGGDWEPLFGRRFEVHRVTGWRAAAALMNRGLITAVLCAQSLPDGSWRDLTAAAAAMKEPPAVIVASRLADERLWAEVLNLGGYDLLAVPLVENELARSLELAWHHWANRSRQGAQDEGAVQLRPQETQVCLKA